MSIDTTVGSPCANSYATPTEAGAYFEQVYTNEAAPVWGSLSKDVREKILVSATRQIDQLRLQGVRLFGYGSGIERGGVLAGHEQALSFPRGDHPYLSGSALDSSTATVLRDEALIRPTVYPDDFFVGGSLVIRAGANQFAMRLVSAYDAATGEVTVNTPFDAALDSTSRYRLLYPVATSVKRAQLSQAGAILERSISALRLQGHGVSRVEVGTLSLHFENQLRMPIAICPEAVTYLSPYLASASCLIGGVAAAR